MMVEIFSGYVNRFDTIPACDGRTDRQTDGQTPFHGIVRIMHVRRAVIRSAKHDIPAPVHRHMLGADTLGSFWILARFDPKFNHVILELLPIYCESFTTTAVTVMSPANKQTPTTGIIQ